MHRLTVYSFLLFFLSCTNDDSSTWIGYRFELSLLNDTCAYNSNSHCAFTCLTEFEGNLLLAFREGKSHRPTSTEDYGHITVLQENGGTWDKIADLSHPDMDLRDPFFIQIDGKLRMYCGYNQFVNDKYQHSGTVYSDLTESGWTSFTPIQHDVKHITWLWKIRKMEDVLYGVGYLEGEKLVLLRSYDGVVWKTVTELMLDGVLSETDLCFSGDSMYVCVRQDTPIGSPSHWGKAKYPFKKFEWKIMDVSVASPELFIHPLNHQIFLAGREYDLRNENKPDSINVSLFGIDVDGVAKRLLVFNTNADGDKGYPSFLSKNGKLYMSYYYGNSVTQVNVAEIGMERKNE